MDVHNSRGRDGCWDIASFKERHQISLYDFMIHGKKFFYYGEKNVQHQKWQEEEDDGWNKKMAISQLGEGIRCWDLSRSKERGQIRYRDNYDFFDKSNPWYWFFH